jgi:hypothetical protein
MDLRELLLEQEVKDESRIAPIILLSPLSYPPDLGSVSDGLCTYIQEMLHNPPAFIHST